MSTVCFLSKRKSCAVGLDHCKSMSDVDTDTRGTVNKHHGRFDASTKPRGQIQVQHPLSQENRGVYTRPEAGVRAGSGTTRNLQAGRFSEDSVWFTFNSLASVGLFKSSWKKAHLLGNPWSVLSVSVAYCKTSLREANGVWGGVMQ